MFRRHRPVSLYYYISIRRDRSSSFIVAPLPIPLRGGEFGGVHVFTGHGINSLLVDVVAFHIIILSNNIFGAAGETITYFYGKFVLTGL